MSFDQDEYLKRWRQQRKDNHLCRECGKQDERTLKGFVRCEICNNKELVRAAKRRDNQSKETKKPKSNYDPEWYKLLKKNHLCTKCKRQDAFTLMGRAKCAVCSEKANRRQRERRRLDESDKAEKARERYQRWKSEGKCTSCGNPLPAFTKTLKCNECRLRDKKKRDEKRQAELLELDVLPGSPGICVYCTNPVVEGKKTCAVHYASLVNCMAKARQAQKDKQTQRSHVWNRYNTALYKAVKNNAET